MKTSDLIVGGVMAITGTALYWCNRKSPEKNARRNTLVGLTMVFVGTLIAIGEWLVRRILNGD
jgi:hypothetical protein